MITKMWLLRSQKDGTPAINLFFTDRTGITTSVCYEVSEELYNTWVPDSNGPAFKGENVREGVIYDVPLKANLKG